MEEAGEWRLEHADCVITPEQHAAMQWAETAAQAWQSLQDDSLEEQDLDAQHRRTPSPHDTFHDQLTPGLSPFTPRSTGTCERPQDRRCNSNQGLQSQGRNIQQKRDPEENTKAEEAEELYRPQQEEEEDFEATEMDRGLAAPKHDAGLRPADSQDGNKHQCTPLPPTARAALSPSIHRHDSMLYTQDPALFCVHSEHGHESDGERGNKRGSAGCDAAEASAVGSAVSPVQSILVRDAENDEDAELVVDITELGSQLADSDSCLEEINRENEVCISLDGHRPEELQHQCAQNNSFVQQSMEATSDGQDLDLAASSVLSQSSALSPYESAPLLSPSFSLTRRRVAAVEEEQLLLTPKTQIRPPGAPSGALAPAPVSHEHRQAYSPREHKSCKLATAQVSGMDRSALPLPMAAQLLGSPQKRLKLVPSSQSSAATSALGPETPLAPGGAPLGSPIFSSLPSYQMPLPKVMSPTPILFRQISTSLSQVSSTPGAPASSSSTSTITPGQREAHVVCPDTGSLGSGRHSTDQLMTFAQWYFSTDLSVVLDQ